MMTGRVIAALCHGAFFGIGSVVAASLVAPEKAAGAIAIMFTGLTAANVLGVPFGTFLGQESAGAPRSGPSPRSACSPSSASRPSCRASARDGPAPEPAPRTRGPSGPARSGSRSLVTVLGFGGMFGAFTYIAYTLTEVSGFDSAAVPWLLVLFGAGLVVGNWIGGRLADRSIDRTLLGFIAALVVVLALFAWLAWSPVATVVLLVAMGGFGFGTVPGLQSRVMRYAAQAPTLASGANIGAFNLGNALGAWAGGVAITAGLGYTSPIWVGALITLAALLVMIVAAITARGARTPCARRDSGCRERRVDRHPPRRGIRRLSRPNISPTTRSHRLTTHHERDVHPR